MTMDTVLEMTGKTVPETVPETVPDLMQAEQPAPLAGASAKRWPQAAADSAAKTAAKTAASGRKWVLAVVGVGAFVLDGAAAVYRSGEHLLESAERRGTTMESAARRRFGKLEEQAVGEMRKLQGQAEEGMEQMRVSRSGVNEEIEKRVELVLANMGLPSRERLERLSQEIDALNQMLDEQILRLPTDPIPDQLG